MQTPARAGDAVKGTYRRYAAVEPQLRFMSAPIAVTELHAGSSITSSVAHVHEISSRASVAEHCGNCIQAVTCMIAWLLVHHSAIQGLASVGPLTINVAFIDQLQRARSPIAGESSAHSRRRMIEVWCSLSSTNIKRHPVL